MAMRLTASSVGCRYNGADSEAPLSGITAALDPGSGVYISSLVSDGKTWPFNPAYLFTLSVYAVGFDLVIDLTALDFTFVSESTEDGVSTFTFDGAGLFVGITVLLYVTKTNAGISYRHEVTACPVYLSIQWFRFPYLKLPAYGELEDSYAFLSYFGGSGFPLPHTYTSLVFAASPPFALYGGFYDAASKTCLMAWCDDENANGKVMALQGDGVDATTFYVQHNYDRRYTGGELFAKTYEVHLEIFAGRAADGRMCHYDLHDRFRAWSDEADSFNARGAWRDSDAVSERAKAARVMFSFGANQSDWTRHRLALTRLQDHLGATEGEIHARLYSWQPAPYVESPPDVFQGAPLATNYTDELAILQAAGISCHIYVLVRLWLSTLTGTYDPTDFGAFGDITPAFLRDELGALKVSDDDFYQWDYSQALVDNIINAVIDSYWAAHGAEKPHGIYQDVEGMSTLGDEFNDDPAASGWDVGSHQQGYQSVSALIKSNRTGSDAEFMVSREWPDPFLIETDDFQFMAAPAVIPESGRLVRSPSYVFGELVRFADYNAPGLFDPDSSTLLYASIQYMTVGWLTTGIMSIVDRTTAGDLVSDPVEENAIYHLWDYCRVLYDVMEYAEPYFQGRRMRPLGSEEAEILSQLEGVVDEGLWLITQGWEYPVRSGVWQRDTGDLGILVCHTHRSTMPSPFGTPPAGPQAVEISLNHRAYDLTSGPKKLVQNVAGERVLLARWTTDVSVEVEVDPFTATLFEVIEDDGT